MKERDRRNEPRQGEKYESSCEWVVGVNVLQCGGGEEDCMWESRSQMPSLAN